MILITVVLAGCNPDVFADHSGCDATSAPVPHPKITQGLAGFASSAEDDCDPTCDCALGGGDIEVFALRDDASDPCDVVVDEPSATIHFGRDGYEQETDSGEFVACAIVLDHVDHCTIVTVENGQVTSMHLRGWPDNDFAIFDGAGKRVKNGAFHCDADGTDAGP